MKKRDKKRMPSTSSIKNFIQLKEIKYYFKSSKYWDTDCYTVARGVAAGLAGAVLPGFQFLYAAILVLLFRGNLPIALLCTLITNPLTVLPVTYFIYYIGALIIGNGHTTFTIKPFEWDFSSLNVFWSNVGNWALQFGKAFFVGLPIVSAGLAVIGYFGTILVWKIVTKIQKLR